MSVTVSTSARHLSSLDVFHLSRSTACGPQELPPRCVGWFTIAILKRVLPAVKTETNHAHTHRRWPKLFVPAGHKWLQPCRIWYRHALACFLCACARSRNLIALDFAHDRICCPDCGIAPAIGWRRDTVYETYRF